MKLKSLHLILITLLTTSMAQAMKWSSCVSITAVTDYRAFESGGVYFSVSPAVPGCNYGGVNRLSLAAGVHNVTPEIQKTGIALGMAANLTDKQVHLFYDETAKECFIQIIALGGYDGSCK